jgi:hypothetical protein
VGINLGRGTLTTRSSVVIPVPLKALAANITGIFHFDFIYRFTLKKDVEPL